MERSVVFLRFSQGALTFKKLRSIPYNSTILKKEVFTWIHVAQNTEGTQSVWFDSYLNCSIASTLLCARHRNCRDQSVAWTGPRGCQREAHVESGGRRSLGLESTRRPSWTIPTSALSGGPSKAHLLTFPSFLRLISRFFTFLGSWVGGCLGYNCYNRIKTLMPQKNIQGFKYLGKAISTSAEGCVAT